MKRETMLMSTGMALAMLFSLAVSAQEATPSVDEIVKKTNHVAYYQGKDGRARVKMTITDKQGNTREREFTILRRNMDEN
ncbi:MAG TPA: outer membrane lipoprotein-sorting protein, partial [Candidatus Hydrogenedentes bacterium]|nr:outer membrane lipoprotein-sorting protein [Candidatus Hydrogenedentota bacterium]